MKQIKVLICLSFTLLITLTNSRIEAQTQQNKIMGRVVDSISKSPIPYVMVLLLNPTDSVMKAGVTTNENGSFEFAALKGSFLLKLRMMGYKELIKTISIDPNKATELGQLLLNQVANELNVVTILAKQPIIVPVSGGYKVEVENNPIIIKSQSAMEVLKAIPGVIVSGSNVSVIGKDGLMIQINGIDKKIEGDRLAAFLNTISGDNIKQIEVIRNPSSVFNSSIGCIINIITKHQLRDGYFGTIRGQVGTYKKYLGGLNFSIIKTKFNFDMSVYERFNRTFRFFEDKVRYIQNQTTSDEYTLTTDNPNAILNNQSGNASFTYKISDNQIIGGNINYLTYKSIDLTSNHLTSEAVVPLLPNTFLIKDHKNSYGKGYIDLYYRSTFKNKNQFVLQFNSTFTNIDNRDANNQTTLVNGLNQIYNNEQSSLSYERAYTLKAVYNLKISGSVACETGGEYIAANLNDHFKDKPLPPSDLQNQEVTDYFKYNENVAAAFINFKITRKKWNYMMGLRNEYMTYNSLSREILKNDFNKSGLANSLYPSVSISHNINEKQTMTFGFRQNITRPGFSSYNPFQLNYSPIQIYKGNPDLKPSMNNGGDITYIFQPSKTQMYMLIGGITYSNKVIGAAAEVDSVSNKLIFTNQNLADMQHLYLSLSTQNNFTDWFSLETSLSIFQDNYKRMKESLKVSGENLPSISFSLNSNIVLPLKINSYIGYQYTSTTITAQGKINSSHYIDIEFDRTFFNDKIDTSFTIVNPFHRTNNTTEVNSATMQSQFKYLSEAAVFRLGISYKFGKEKNTTIQKQNAITNMRM
jgi:hypothetical protein